jgi:hypothetical protein
VELVRDVCHRVLDVCFVNPVPVHFVLAKV